MERVERCKRHGRGGSRIRAHPAYYRVSRRHRGPLQRRQARRGARPRQAQPVLKNIIKLKARRPRFGDAWPIFLPP